MDPENLKCLRSRSKLYLDLGEPERAVRDWDESILLASDDLLLLSNRRVAAEEAGLPL